MSYTSMRIPNNTFPWLFAPPLLLLATWIAARKHAQEHTKHIRAIENLLATLACDVNTYVVVVVVGSSTHDHP